MIFRLWPAAMQAATPESPDIHPGPCDRVILDQEASLEDWKALFETEEFKRALEEPSSGSSHGPLTSSKTVSLKPSASS